MTFDEGCEWIGSYKILHVLDEGGMGTVYLAMQEQPLRRTVALKVIKLGMDTREVVARFESERQALALMHHRNVAMVYDAGVTSEGRPYFVMEYVRGENIVRHCDRERLTTRGRLELFIEVCEGIQHAHHKGIIHRDIKPHNVLVAIENGRPVPKIIDFGVAKATNQRLTEKTIYTEQGRIIGTPEYMSPEQAELTVADVDTRTDVYSLGVLLYELLVEELPFGRRTLRDGGYAAMQKIIREEEPPMPSSRLSRLGKDAEPVAERRRTDSRGLRQQLRGDLDWITMKAIEKDRTRRYASAGDLAADVSRHLHGLPVLASRPDFGYWLKRQFRRHRQAVAVATLTVTFLAILGGLILWREQNRAIDEARMHNRRGLELLGERRFTQAIDQFSKALQHLPEEVEVRQNLGVAYERQGQYREAVQEYTRAVRLDPRRSQTYEAITNVLRLRTELDFSPDLKSLQSVLEQVAGSEVEISLPLRFHVLAGVLIDDSPAEKLARMERVALVFGRKRGEVAKAVSDLAELHFAMGRRREAVLVLERASRSPNSLLRLKEQLKGYRVELLPDLVSYCSIDDAIESAAATAASRVSRSVRALEIIGSDASRMVLKDLADRPLWRSEATAALQRLARRVQNLDSGLAEDFRVPSQSTVKESVVYTNDFDVPVGPEWSRSQAEVTPGGERSYLGRFGKETVRVSLEELPPHQFIRLSFQLLVLRSWDGSSQVWGPDFWTLAVEGGPTLIHTTLSGVSDLRQAYPDFYPVGDYTFDTGASDVDTLGYPFHDAVYPLNVVFPHVSSQLVLEFVGGTTERMDDESWGLDNLTIEVMSSPEMVKREELQALVANLEGGDPVRANQALWKLVATGDQGAAHLREHVQLRDPVLDVFESFCSTGGGAVSQCRRAYFEGRLLQRAGEHRRALSKFEEVVSTDRSWPEPFLRVIECHRALGELEAAEALLRNALAAGIDDCDELWDAWFSVALGDLNRSSAEALRTFPRASRRGDESRGSHIRWLLEQLRDRGRLRINCGGGEFHGADGAMWGQDRFFTAGYRHSGDRIGDATKSFSEDIAGTADDKLYQTERLYPRAIKETFDPPGYRIPLPPGDYRVTLHFAEIFSNEGARRVFDVLLEDTPFLVAYEPLMAGHGTATQETCEVTVKDGFLDLDFVHRKAEPQVSAIEITSLEGRR